MNFESTEDDPKSQIYKELYEEYKYRLIDLRPYMIARPLTVFENDGL